MARAEFERRRATARRKVGAGDLEPSDAEALLRPWLALACRCGSECPEIEPMLEDLRKIGAGDRPFLREREVRSLVADDLADLLHVRETVAAARDALLDRAGDPERAHALVALAAAVNAPPYRPETLGKAA